MHCHGGQQRRPPITVIVALCPFAINLFLFLVISWSLGPRGSFALSAPNGQQWSRDRLVLDQSAVVEEKEEEEKREEEKEEEEKREEGKEEKGKVARVNGEEEEEAQQLRRGGEGVKGAGKRRRMREDEEEEEEEANRHMEEGEDTAGPVPPPPHHYQQFAEGGWVGAFASANYQPPATRPRVPPRMPSRQPPDPALHLHPPPSLPLPRLSFRSPTGQYVPLWSPAGASFAVPAPDSVSGIAYYAPNQSKGQQAADGDGRPGGRKGPPILFVGAFPPSYRLKTPPAPQPPAPSAPSSANEHHRAGQEQRTPRPEFTFRAPVGHFLPGPPFRWTTSSPSLISSTGTISPNYYNPPEVPTTRDPCQETPKVQSTKGPEGTVPNRPIGKARLICRQEGLEFGLRTVFPFTGQIFAYDRKRIANCVHIFTKEPNINTSFSFAQCGIRNAIGLGPSFPFRSNTSIDQFHLQIVVIFEQQNGATTVQSYFAHCEQNRVGTADEGQWPMVRHVEEALEELHFVPIELEKKAPLPLPKMRLLNDNDKGLSSDDGADRVHIAQFRMGQPVRVEFSLQPETDAYGFLVRNCVVRDGKSGVEHEVIDGQGCSADLSLLDHPQYDTNLDIARVRWNAFKLPDQSHLSLICRMVLCTELATKGDRSSCAALPTPPFCANLVTSPVDSVLADLPSPSHRNSSFHPTSRVRRMTPIGANWAPPAEWRVRAFLHLRSASSSADHPPPHLCLPSIISSLFCFSLLLLAIFANLICRCIRRPPGS